MHESRVSFYRLDQQSLDTHGLVHFYGTNAVFMRPAVEQICGFASGVMTEDTPTGFNVLVNGWRSVFVDQRLATGSAKQNTLAALQMYKCWWVGNILFALLYLPFGRYLLSAEFLSPPGHAEFLRERARMSSDESEEQEAASNEEAGDRLPKEAVRRARCRSWASSLAVMIFSVHVITPLIMAFYYLSFVLSTMALLHPRYMAMKSMLTLDITPILFYVSSLFLVQVVQLWQRSSVWHVFTDTFTFGWVRVISVVEACSTALGVSFSSSRKWHSGGYVLLVIPTLCIPLAIAAASGQAAWALRVASQEENMVTPMPGLLSIRIATRLLGICSAAIFLLCSSPFVACIVKDAVLARKVVNREDPSCGSTMLPCALLVILPLVLVLVVVNQGWGVSQVRRRQLFGATSAH